MIADNARILQHSVHCAMADMRVIYTWRTWSFAWLSRILTQVAFFALIGRLLNSPERTHFLLVGNAVYIVALVAMQVCASSAWERQTGTLPLLIASPSHPFVIFVGRSVQWLLDGTACATVSLFVLGPVFGVDLPMPRALLTVPVIALTGVSTYCFGLFLSGFVLRRLESRNLVSGVSGLVLMLLCGVQTPTDFWPAPFQYLADALPLTHGLRAIRHLLDGAPVAAVSTQIGLELCVAAGWLLTAALTFRTLTEGGRKDGSIEYGD